MKSTRIWFHKFGTAKYISHLDLNRCVARAFHKAKLPMWYTEGFNPHAFVTFALPLSLGVEENMNLWIFACWKICQKKKLSTV